MSATVSRKSKAKPPVTPLRDLLPAPSGDYCTDIEGGEKCARALLAQIKASKSNDRCRLGMMIMEMIELGFPKKAKGVIVGFMGEVASRIEFHPWEKLLREQQGGANAVS